MGVRVEHDKKNVKGVKINYLVSNEGVFYEGVFLGTLLLETYFMFNFLYGFILFLEGLNFLEIKGEITSMNVHFFQVVLSNIFGDLNLITEIAANQKVIESIPIGLNTNGYILLFVSIILSLIFNFFFYIQSYKQRKLKDCDLNTYYEDFYMIYKNYKNTNKNIYYIKPLKMFKNMKNLREKRYQEEIKKNYFGINELDFNNYILDITKPKILYFYEYIKIELKLKKSKSDTEQQQIIEEDIKFEVEKKI